MIYFTYMDFDTLKDLATNKSASSTKKNNICLVRGENNTVFDVGGRAYIDFCSGSGENVLGYSHPKLIQAVAAQSEKLLCIGNAFYNELFDSLKHELIENTAFDKVLLEKDSHATLINCFKIIHNYYEKKKQNKKILIVSDWLNESNFRLHFPNSAQTQDGFLKFTPENDFTSFKNNFTSDVGAVMLETFQIDNGLSITKHDFLLQAYAHSKSNDALLIMNEFISGVGRTAQMFSYKYSGINPDIVLLSKGLGGGLPISALLARGELAYSIPKDSFVSSSTFLPSLAAAKVVINELKCGLLERIANVGNYFKAKLFKLSKFDFVKEIHGSGLILGITLDEKVPVAQIVALSAKEGILISASRQKNSILFLPPYTITRQEIDTAVEILSQVFSKI